ncbi:MAG: family 20 glycosylhydrolase [Clostridiales bacterium]|nr:family 20 glycosylhydrolase [Clostridiales bacterium]
MTLNTYETLRGGKYLSAGTKIHTDNEVLISLMKIYRPDTEGSYGNIYFWEGIPEDVKKELGDTYKYNEEGYAIVLEEDITVYSETEKGFIYACCDLLRMRKDDIVPQGLVYNRPLAPIRYLKLFTPAEWEIEDFKKIVDYCCYCRCNGIMMEISGGMEYKRRPEINDEWVKYCEFMTEYSGKTEDIQHGFPWDKNSIHVENAGGKVLSQKTLREMVLYCRERGIEIIPEVPSLSHCDFLILPYRDIAERKEDPYPDTYCPSNPKSYEILFDVLDEVIEVIEPRYINIGHDEYYSIGLCDRCKDRDAADIFADDVIKIYDYLAGKGVRTMFWADKIIEVPLADGRKWGGAEYDIYHKGEKVGTVPATYRSIERMPKDIICINWSSGAGRIVDNMYLERGFDMVYGNFNPTIMPELKSRFDAGAKGGGPSNWSFSNLTYMQVNRHLFDLYYASLLFWNDGYADDRYDEALKTSLTDMFRFSSADKYAVPHIEFIHTTTFYRQFTYFYDGTFIDYNVDNIGKYVIEYYDGTNYEIPIVYSQNISNKDRRWYRPPVGTMLFDDEFIMYGTNYSRTNRFHDVDRLLMSSGFGTEPIVYGEDTYFRYITEKPFPDKRIKGVTLIEEPGKEGTVILKSIRY